MSFKIPLILDNRDGWGPPPDSVPEKYAELPFAPFSKDGKVGRAANWNQQRHGQRYGQQHDEEDQFKLIDHKPAQRPQGWGPRTQRRQQVQRRGWGNRDTRRRGRRGGGGEDRFRGRRGWGRFGRQWDDWKEAPNREWSIEVKDNWRLTMEVELSSLSTKAVETEPTVKELSHAGWVELYDKSCDRISSRLDKKLERSERTFYSVTSSDDPVLRQLSEEDRPGTTVFATDTILAALMTAPRALYGFDVIITREGSTIWLDKRESGTFDFLTVNETSLNPPSSTEKDSANSAQKLSAETTMINQQVSQQLLVKDKKHALGEGHPFAAEEEEPAAVGYIYKEFQLNEDTAVIVRTEVHTLLKEPKEGEAPLYTAVHAVNEFDAKAGVDWRQKIDKQSGSILATEIKNNQNKMARWAIQALLASAKYLKLAFLSRVHSRDAFNHTILGVQQYRSSEFASMVSLNMKNAWGIIEELIPLVPPNDGRYILIKHPNKAELHFYELPADFEDEELDNEEGEGEADEYEADAEAAAEQAAVVSEVLGF